MVMTVARKREYVALGQRIAELRRRTPYSQKQLGELVGLSAEFIGNIERGWSRPDTDYLLPMAEILGARYSDLAELAGYYKPDNTDGWTPPPELVPRFRRWSQLPQSLLDLMDRLTWGGHTDETHPPNQSNQQC